ncbi:DUF2793 domain-containing protein [Shinella yambaruensis]|uniref:DUF2793 domain-containing protein n=1 Tax=Shinella yambaruensis TaxID=415996 RepID=A0ABQ5ZDW0_9HYPH|nr:DUF2793 domain-containing protein [Shinella yambaruensis]MCJ8029551.1 DUF2793 domain-containing protein [Shinella yambaruensis]MCU7983739.1 DUF2793 domain-containing protein [Shinella yambaruensis]GLR48802.1 hypothetical protein GCM10007923_00060 [Shinella yambaruensis]
METTAHLALPYIMPSQAQKHVTHNEALRMLDALVQLSVADRVRTVPPPAPAEGDRHIVGPSAQDAWEGRDGQVAAWQDGAWAYFQPAEGWQAWVEEEQSLLLFNGGQWGPPGGTFQNLAMVGINTTADATNRLAIAGDTVLLNHDGAGHRLKINKAAPGDTASLLFQTGFSGRAEMGTAGDDDFHVKVSGDGATWSEAIVIDRGTGAVSFPNTHLQGGRERLVADRIYYVRTDGSNGNDGLSNSAAGAFKTVQHAIDIAYGTIDLGPHHVTIQLGDGVYDGSLQIQAPHVGSGTITLAGNAGTPASTVVARSAPFNYALHVTGGAEITIRDFEIRSASNTVLATLGGKVRVRSGMRFGLNASASSAQLLAQTNGIIDAGTASYAVVGNAGWHYRALIGGVISASNAVVDVSGRNFATAFAQGERLGIVSALSASFTGSATGKRYAAFLNGVVFTSGGPNLFPGDTAGTTESGGQYG